MLMMMFCNDRLGDRDGRPNALLVRLGRGGRRGRHERVITGHAKEPGLVGAEPHALRMQIERGVLLRRSKKQEEEE